MLLYLAILISFDLAYHFSKGGINGDLVWNTDCFKTTVSWSGNIVSSRILWSLRKNKKSRTWISDPPVRLKHRLKVLKRIFRVIVLCFSKGRVTVRGWSLFQHTWGERQDYIASSVLIGVNALCYLNSLTYLLYTTLCILLLCISLL